MMIHPVAIISFLGIFTFDFAAALPPVQDVSVADTTQAHKYYSMAAEYEGHSQYDSALLYYQKAKEIFSKYEMSDDYLIKCYNHISNCLWKTGKYPEAQQLLEETLVLGKTKLGKEHPEIANTYHAMGIVHDIMGKSDAALEMLQKALDIRHTAFGANHTEVAKSYFEMAIVHFGKGEFQRALEANTKSLNIYREVEGENNSDVAGCYNILGVLYDNLGEYDKALDNYERALAIRLEILGDAHPDVATTCSNLGLLHKTTGNYNQALEYFDKAVDIRTSTFGEKHPVVATTYNNMGITYNIIGDFEKAISYHHKALSIRQQVFGESHSEVAASYHNLGSSHNALGFYEKALDFYHKTLVINKANLGENHPYLASNYHNLGIVYKDKGEYDEALRHFEKALFIDQQVYGQNHPYVAANYMYMGIVCNQQEKYTQALHYLHQALDIYTAKLDGNSVETGTTLAHIGQVYENQQIIDTALQYYQQSIIALSEEFANEDIYANPVLTHHTIPKKELLTSLELKANLLKQLPDANVLSASYETYMLASDLVTLLRTKYDTEASKLFLSKKAGDLYEKAINTTLELYEHTRDKQYIQAALALAEKNKSGLLLEALHNLKTQRLTGISDSLLTLEQQIKTELAFTNNLLHQAYSKPEQDENKLTQLQEDIFSLNIRYEHLIATIEENYPAYYALKYDIPGLEISTFQNAYLQENQHLIAFFTGKDHIFAWLLNKNQIDYVKTTKPTDFETDVRAFLSSLKNRDFNKYADKGYALYQTLVEPVLAKANNSDADHLLIIPDGILGYLPFETLIRKKPANTKGYKDLHYLIEDFEIAYHYSAGLLAFEQTPQTKPQQAFIGFAPAFKDDTEQLLLTYNESVRSYIDSAQALPYAEEEVQTIASLLGGNAYTGASASEQSFKEYAGNYNIIHLASHSLVDDAEPLYSKLIFDNESDSLEDGLLHTYELYNMQLNAGLVTLSACNTGVGKYYKGEGIVSLARGFMYAGVPNVMMSLWSVADRPTKDIMQYFYEELNKGTPYATALHKAKLRFLEKADNLTADPYYWGAFIYLGQPTESASLPNSKIWWIGIFLVFLLLITGMVMVRKNR